ncbi:13254_t:CDS:2, partial [Gigaspora rosea]
KLMEKNNAVDNKKNMDINKLNKRESNSTKVTNSKKVPMKSDCQDDTFKVVDNGGEAADSKANGYQYRNGKNGQKAFAHCQSLRKTSYGYKARDHGRDDKKRDTQYDLSYRRSNNKRLMFGSSIKSASHRHKNMKAGMLSTLKLYDDKDLEKGSGRCRWDIACCDKDEVVSTVFGSRFEMRKLELMDMSCCNFEDEVTK